MLALRQKWYAAIPASELKSFPSGGRGILLKGIQGIFKPKELDQPLSILSTLGSPYTDELLEGQKILYDFAPRSREYDNDGLKECAENKIPLIYLLQLKGKPQPEYQVFAPVTVAAWDDVARQFVGKRSATRGQRCPIHPTLHRGRVPEQIKWVVETRLLRACRVASIAAGDSDP